MNTKGKRKRKYTKYLYSGRKKTLFINGILFLLLFIGLGYSVLGVNLSINGNIKVKEKANTLYEALKNEAEKSSYVAEYTNTHQDSIDTSLSTEKIYYYDFRSNSSDRETLLDMNNVIFADHCWQIVRTTDTGGVKLIYNGEVVDNKCLNTRGEHVGYLRDSIVFLAQHSYWYGTDYTYDSNQNAFKVSGSIEQATWSSTTADELIGKYTCAKENSDDTCAYHLLMKKQRLCFFLKLIRITLSLEK